ncbi:MAG: hypothetical protein K1X88_31125 [Nannocystaceae bacterium]|nr:hypothetical protein [Nannocystaceae bacterium]
MPPRWAKVARPRLIRREVRESLSPGALDLLLAHAEVVIEGDQALGRRNDGAPQVFATVMVTIDLPRCAERFREPADAETVLRVVELLRESASLRLRLVELARPRLAALAGVAPDTLEISLEPQLRADGVRLLIDGDAVGWPRAARRR